MNTNGIQALYMGNLTTVSQEQAESLLKNLTSKTIRTQYGSVYLPAFAKYKPPQQIVSVLDDTVDELISPMIAGGFLRDMVVGIPPKDLDIFISVHPSEYPYLIEELLPNLASKWGWTEDDTSKASSPPLGGNTVITYDWDGLPIQFIISGKSLSYILKMFDYSINQIWWTDAGLCATSAFMTTLKTGKVKSLTNNPNPARQAELQKKLSMFTWPEIKLEESSVKTKTAYFKKPEPDFYFKPVAISAVDIETTTITSPALE